MQCCKNEGATAAWLAMGIVQPLVDTHSETLSKELQSLLNALIVCSTPGEKEVDRGVTASIADGTEVKGKGSA